jgi:endonuclease-3
MTTLVGMTESFGFFSVYN